MNRNHRYPISIDYLTLVERYEPNVFVFMIHPDDLELLRTLVRHSALDASPKGGRVQLPIHEGRLVATAASPLIVNDRAGNPTAKVPTLGADVSVSGMFQASHDRRSGLTTVRFSMTSIKSGGKAAKNRPKRLVIRQPVQGQNGQSTAAASLILEME